jgi:nucleoside-diphosphate-sugar epimerase
MHGQRVLVLGASGFIGKPLACELARSNKVDGLGLFPDPSVRRELETAGVMIIEADVVGAGLSGVSTDYDYVFSELAALPNICNANLPLGKALNITFVGKVVSHFRNARGLVLASTGSLYQPHERPIGEDGWPGPWDAYNVTKLIGDELATFLGQEYQVPIAIPRYFFPYTATRGMVANAVRLVASGQPIPRYPHARVQRNPIHLDDLVRLTIASAQICRVPAEIVNIAGSEIIDDETLIRMVATHLSRDVSFVDADVPPPFWAMDFMSQGKLVPRPNIVFYNIEHPAFSWLADTTKLNAYVGTPEVSLRHAIQQCVEAVLPE